MDGIDSISSSLAPRKEWFSLGNPFGIIGGFSALVEVAMILGVIFTDGAIQWVMLTLAAVFFFATAGPFFFTLWKKNWVFYAPKEYGADTGVHTYVEAMSYRVTGKPSGEHSTTTVVSASVMQPELPQGALARGEWIDERGNGQTPGTQRFLLVFMAPRSQKSLGLRVDYDDELMVHDCLSFIADALLPQLPESANPLDKRTYYVNYGRSWILRDSTSGGAVTDIGPRWTWKTSGNLFDVRLLKDTPLKPGMHLELERLSDQVMPISDLLADGGTLLAEERPLNL